MRILALGLFVLAAVCLGLVVVVMRLTREIAVVQYKLRKLEVRASNIKPLQRGLAEAKRDLATSARLFIEQAEVNQFLNAEIQRLKPQGKLVAFKPKRPH